MIVNYIKEHREEIGITQRELSLRSGVRQSTISQLESGKRQPMLEPAMRIMEALGCQLDEIFKIL